MRTLCKSSHFCKLMSTLEAHKIPKIIDNDLNVIF